MGGIFWSGWEFFLRLIGGIKDLAVPKFMQMPRTPRERGSLGERLAARALRRKGYKILRRNFRPSRGGEIDIVARDGEVLVFIEVKSRAGEDFGRPIDAVDRRKRLRIVRGAMAWLRMLDFPEVVFRFDVVEVLADREVRHIENAFSLPRHFHY